jgi:hypothetical protein
MIITDAMIIKYLVETLRAISINPELKPDLIRFKDDGFFLFKEEIHKFENIKFEVLNMAHSERVDINFKEVL